MRIRGFFQLLFLYSIIFIIVVGCAKYVSTGVFPSGKDTYTLVITGNKKMLLPEMKKIAYKEANDFCEVKAKVLQPIGEEVVPLSPGRHKSYELRFRALNPDDPEYRRPDLEPVPDVKVDVKSQ